MSGEHTLKAVRGSFIDVTRTVDNPEEIASALRFIEDGLLLIKQGKVEWFGEWEDGKHQIPDTIRVRDYRGKLIVPGFVDTHIHYPQSEMVGAYGEQLLEWLNKHTFPTERRYEDLEYYSAAIFLIPICISFDTAEKRRYATYLILNRRFSFEF